MACRLESGAMYDELLESPEAWYETDGTFPAEDDLPARFKGRGGEVVPATTVQTRADRLGKALERFLQMKDVGLPVGFPRFKTPKRRHRIRLRHSEAHGEGMRGRTRTANAGACPPSLGG
jgi:hypothetical protein